jgi:hypothetical protein
MELDLSIQQAELPKWHMVSMNRTMPDRPGAPYAMRVGRCSRLPLNPLLAANDGEFHGDLRTQLRK